MGLQLPKRWDRHHVFSPENQYSNKVRSVENQFRTYSGLVIPTPIVNHNLWNARGWHPPKPDKQEMIDVMDYLDATPPAVQLVNFRLWGVEKAAQFFGALGQEDTEAGQRSRIIQENLLQQIGVFSMQLVDIRIVE